MSNDLFVVDRPEIQRLALWSGPMHDMAKAALAWLESMDVIEPAEPVGSFTVEPNTVYIGSPISTESLPPGEYLLIPLEANDE